MVVNPHAPVVDFELTIENFLTQNKIVGSEEEYIKNFKQKAGRFLGQSKVEQQSEVREILLRMLNDYKYYSKSYIEDIFKNFYNYLVKRVKEERTIYSPISSEKDIARMNSSYFYLQKFLEINNLSNEQAINLSALYLDNDNKFYKKALNFKDEKKKSVSDIAKEKTKLFKKLTYIDTVVFIDDFSGTGDTIKKFLKKAAEMVKEKQVFVFVIHVTERAKGVINKAFQDYDYKNAKLIYENESKEFFETNVEFKQEREQLLQFESEIIKSEHPLGYKESEALVTFYRNCPNNTISSYWWNENKDWSPLFPRKNKVLDFFGVKRFSELYEAILYNLTLIMPKHLSKKYEFKEILYLLYLNEFSNDKEVFEIRKILGYNNNQLLEQHERMLGKDWIDTEGKLTLNGLAILKELKLIKTNFSELTKEKNIEKSSDSLSFDDAYIPVRLL